MIMKYDAKLNEVVEVEYITEDEDYIREQIQNDEIILELYIDKGDKFMINTLKAQLKRRHVNLVKVLKGEEPRRLK